MPKHKTFLGWDIFKRTRELEAKITSFLLNIVEAGILYEQAIQTYTQKQADNTFIALRDRISELEAQNDAYRRQVENDLYAYMILPDMRSDILRILEGCDKIINKYQSNLLIVSIEQPLLWDELKKLLLEMVHHDLSCVDSLVSGVKSFFSGHNVDEFTQRTHDFEHIVDEQAFQLKTMIYANNNISLAHKLQLKEFIYNIEKISDIAEDVADVLKIVAVKHAL